VIRLNIPALSGDVRKKMVARTKELAEEAKVALRNIRRDANKAIEQAEKDKVIGEDERDALKEEVQDLLKKREAEIDTAARSKEAEVLGD
jgi:ribosome recycling factor